MKQVLENFLRGKWLKHPLHPVLVHVPMALWPSALIFDLLSQSDAGGNALVRLSTYCLAFGLLVAILAVLPGLADWSAIKKEKPAWKLGLYHMALNLAAAVVVAVNLGVRMDQFKNADRVEPLGVALSAAVIVLIGISGYLGGLMVYEHGTGVARMSKKKWRRIAEAAGANVPPPDN